MLTNNGFLLKKYCLVEIIRIFIGDIKMGKSVVYFHLSNDETVYLEI